MERLLERLQLADKTLNAFHEVLKIENPSSIERDAAIQRFVFSFEACWKAAKQFLYDIEGLDIGSPKSVIRSIREMGIFSEDETVLSLRMVNDRNLTVHTYNEKLSIEIFERVPSYYKILRDLIDRINSKSQQ